MSDRRAQIAQLVARVTGADPEDVRLEALKLTSAQRAALEGLCRRHDITASEFNPWGEAAPLAEAVPNSHSVGRPSRLSGGWTAIGCDIQDIGEFQRCVDGSDYKRSTFLTQFASAAEIAYCENQDSPVASLAGLFAAKEAVFKAGHPGPLKAIQISHDNGKPVAEHFAISISHSGSSAMAVAARMSEATGSTAAPSPESLPVTAEYASPPAGALRFRGWVVYQALLLLAVIYLLIVHALH